MAIVVESRAYPGEPPPLFPSTREDREKMREPRENSRSRERMKNGNREIKLRSGDIPWWMLLTSVHPEFFSASFRPGLR